MILWGTVVLAVSIAVWLVLRTTSNRYGTSYGYLYRYWDGLQADFCTSLDRPRAGNGQKVTEV